MAERLAPSPLAAAILAGLPPILRGKSPEEALLTAGLTFLDVLTGFTRRRRPVAQQAPRGVGVRAPAQRAGVIDVAFTEEPAAEAPKGLLPPHEEKP